VPAPPGVSRPQAVRFAFGPEERHRQGLPHIRHHGKVDQLPDVQLIVQPTPVDGVVGVKEGLHVTPAGLLCLDVVIPEPGQLHLPAVPAGAAYWHDVPATNQRPGPAELYVMVAG